MNRSYKDNEHELGADGPTITALDVAPLDPEDLSPLLTGESPPLRATKNILNIADASINRTYVVP